MAESVQNSEGRFQAPWGGLEISVYQVYGLSLVSQLAFPELPVMSSEQPDVYLRFDAGAVPHPCEPPAFQSRLASPTGDPFVTLYRGHGACWLHYPAIAKFYLPDTEHILCHPCTSTDIQTLRTFILGPVLSLVMQNRGVNNLHASAVAVEGAGVAFLATAKGGKSTLAAQFVRSGYALLTDDILPLRFDDGQLYGLPGYPQMKLWPETISHLFGAYRHLPRAAASVEKRCLSTEALRGAFHAQACRLRALYLPEMTASAVGIRCEPVTATRALLALVGHTFTGPWLSPEQRSRQFETYAQVVRQVPVRRLRYPRGFQYLPQIEEAVLNDLQSL